MKKMIVVILCLMLSVLAGCAQGQPSTPSTQPTTGTLTTAPDSAAYQYTTAKILYYWPSLVDKRVEKDALTTTTEDGVFFCFAADTEVADDFIAAQRTLLSFLREYGVDTGKLEYYATDYDDSFSESSRASAYIALSALRTQKQVMVTLQTLWGDYTDYGYVWALSNAIAEQLGWETEAVPAVEQAKLDAFFADNSAALNLLYPSFTVTYASQETVDYCKALSSKLFASIRWQDAISNPVDGQIAAWHKLTDAYGKEISVDFTRQTVGYAYHSKNVPLRVRTEYAQLNIDKNFTDYNTLFADSFSDYKAIYETVNILQDEMTAAVSKIGLEDRVGDVTINFISEMTHARMFADKNRGRYFSSSRTIYVRTLQVYLHEYFHHMEYVINPDLGQCWQSQAFCELGSSYSKYALDGNNYTFAEYEAGVELFNACTGRGYINNRDDYYETMDILCYINGYTLDYQTGGACVNSIFRYLSDLYGEETVWKLMLFPNTVQDVTGETWYTIAQAWEQHIRDKYANVVLPEGYQPA